MDFISKSLIKFFIQMSALNQKLNRLETLLERFMSSRARLKFPIIALFLAICAPILYLAYDFTHTHTAAATLCFLASLPIFGYIFLSAFKRATSFAVFIILFAGIIALYAQAIAHKFGLAPHVDIVFTAIFTLVWFLMSLLADDDVAQITNKVISKLSTLFITVFILYNYDELLKVLSATNPQNSELTAKNLVFMGVRFFTLPSIFTLLVLEVREYLFKKNEIFARKYKEEIKRGIR